MKTVLDKVKMSRLCFFIAFAKHEFSFVKFSNQCFYRDDAETLFTGKMVFDNVQQPTERDNYSYVISI